MSAPELRPSPLLPTPDLAGQTVDGVPIEGQYRWKRSGTQTVAIYSLADTSKPADGGATIY